MRRRLSKSTLQAPAPTQNAVFTDFPKILTPSAAASPSLGNGSMQASPKLDSEEAATTKFKNLFSTDSLDQQQSIHTLFKRNMLKNTFVNQLSNIEGTSQSSLSTTSDPIITDTKLSIDEKSDICDLSAVSLQSSSPPSDIQLPSSPSSPLASITVDTSDILSEPELSTGDSRASSYIFDSRRQSFNDGGSVRSGSRATMYFP